MGVYENVCSIATKKKLTLQELEQKANLGSGCISRWKTISPNLSTLDKVAKALDTTTAKLLK